MAAHAKKSNKPPELSFKSLKQISFTIKEVLKIVFKISPRLFLLVFIFNILTGLLTAPTLYLSKLIIDAIVSGIGTNDVQRVMSSVALLLAAAALLRFAEYVFGVTTSVLTRILSRTMNAKMDVLIARKLSELDLAAIEDPGFRDRFKKVEMESSRRIFSLINPFSSLLGNIVSFISVLGILVSLHPLVALGVLVFSLPRILTNTWFIRENYNLVTKNTARERIVNWLYYFLVRNNNFSELKLLGISDYLSKKMDSIQDIILDSQMKLRKKFIYKQYMSYVLLDLFDFGVQVWIAVLTITGKITIGSFQLYFQAIRSAESDFRSLVSNLTDIYENYIFVNDLVWFLNVEPKIVTALDARKIDYTKGIVIEFRNVWFRYRKKQNWVLKGVSFKIEAKENIALIGENGAGKSTIIKLLARFYDPEKGQILINGVPLQALDLEEWHGQLAVLFQEFEKYPFSVKETVGYGDIDRVESLNEIKEAVKATDMATFVEGLPKKYSNPLEPEFKHGVRPSIGQWQRLGISRILFRKKANVLIMDEPTSNVDPNAEEKIFNELVENSKNKILLFVTQRFSTVRLADRIFVIDDGKIAESGTHGELMKLKGEYAKLFELQAKGYQI